MTRLGGSRRTGASTSSYDVVARSGTTSVSRAGGPTVCGLLLEHGDLTRGTTGDFTVISIAVLLYGMRSPLGAVVHRREPDHRADRLILDRAGWRDVVLGDSGCSGYPNEFVASCRTLNVVVRELKFGPAHAHDPLLRTKVRRSSGGRDHPVVRHGRRECSLCPVNMAPRSGTARGSAVLARPTGASAGSHGGSANPWSIERMSTARRWWLATVRAVAGASDARSACRRSIRSSSWSTLS